MREVSYHLLLFFKYLKCHQTHDHVNSTSMNSSKKLHDHYLASKAHLKYSSNSTSQLPSLFYQTPEYPQTHVTAY